MTRWHHATWVYGDPRWQTLRLAAKRRDGWKCVQCGNKTHLEIDHITRARDRPDLAFTLANLQTLCRQCHSAKTARELGRAKPIRGQAAWLKAVRELACQLNHANQRDLGGDEGEQWENFAHWRWWRAG